MLYITKCMQCWRRKRGGEEEGERGGEIINGGGGGRGGNRYVGTREGNPGQCQ